MTSVRNFEEIQKYYNTHLQNEVSEKFNVSKSALTKWTRKGKLKNPRTQSESLKQAIVNIPNYGRGKTPEVERLRKEKISASMKKNPKCGGYRKGSGRGKKTWYDSSIAGRVFLDSSYELAIAKWMDLEGIVWKKNYVKFPYMWNGKMAYYIPDFFLIKTNEYLEIKGYFTDKDLEKWKSVPHKLYVLFTEDLYKMGIINEKGRADLTNLSQWRVMDINMLGK